MSHTMRFEFDQDSVATTPVCHAPPGADCRAVPRAGCDCEEVVIERAKDGTAFHRVETFGGAEVLHWMDSGGDCNIVEFLAHAPEEYASGEQRFVLDNVQITPEWQGDHYTWTRIKAKR